MSQKYKLNAQKKCSSRSGHGFIDALVQVFVVTLVRRLLVKHSLLVTLQTILCEI